MKKISTLLAAGLFAFSATAQELPVPSPLGEIEQQVGLTSLEIEYSRPSAKDREIFGKLVQFDEIWRLGANSCTKLETSTDIMIEGKKVPKGEYALLAIPGKDGVWTIIINSDTKLRGTNGYDEKKDILRLKVQAKDNSYTETLTFGFDNITSNSAVISIAWERLKLRIPFTVDTDKAAENNIKTAIKEGKDLDKVYSKAASYFMQKEDFKTALKYADKSLKIKESHSAMFTKARIYKAKGDNDKALDTAKAALELANKAESTGWANYIKGTIEEWSK